MRVVFYIFLFLYSYTPWPLHLEWLPNCHWSKSGSLFIRFTDVLSQDLVKSRSRAIWCYNDRIALKCDRHLAAAEVVVKFWSDWKSLNPNLANCSKTFVRKCGKASHASTRTNNVSNTKEKHNKQCAYLMEYNLYITFGTVKSYPVWCVKLMHSNSLRITKPQ